MPTGRLPLGSCDHRLVEWHLASNQEQRGFEPRWSLSGVRLGMDPFRTFTKMTCLGCSSPLLSEGPCSSCGLKANPSLGQDNVSIETNTLELRVLLYWALRGADASAASGDKQGVETREVCEAIASRFEVQLGRHLADDREYRQRIVGGNPLYDVPPRV